MRRGSLLGIGVAVAALAVVAYRVAGGPGLAGPGAGAERDDASAARPVAVAILSPERRDVPIYLDGLGTVEGYQTVTVHSRIDGTLVAVDFREGQDVRAGEVLARIDDRAYKAQLDQDLATRDKDGAVLDSARRDLARYIALKDRVSGQTLDTQRATVKQDEAILRADEAAVEAARVQLSYTVIAAPIAGRAGLQQLDAGNIIHASDSSGLVVVTQLRPIAVTFTLPQQALPQVLDEKDGTTRPLPVVAVESDGRTEIERGQLELVDNQIDASTGTIKLKAVLPNARYRLWPGGFVAMRLLVRTVPDGLVLPATAVQIGPDGPYAFVVGGDGRAEMRPVQVSRVDDGHVLVAAGLSVTDRVVADGAGRVRAGTRVIDRGAGPVPDQDDAAGHGGTRGP